MKGDIQFKVSPGNNREVIKGVPSIGETVPLLTSDMGTRTVEVLSVKHTVLWTPD